MSRRTAGVAGKHMVRESSKVFLSSSLSTGYRLFPLLQGFGTVEVENLVWWLLPVLYWYCSTVVYQKLFFLSDFSTRTFLYSEAISVEYSTFGF